MPQFVEQPSPFGSFLQYVLDPGDTVISDNFVNNKTSFFGLGDLMIQ